jgi:hypothetical protein
MPRANRKAAIEELQKARDGSVVISYITSTRQGLETQMAMDVIGPVYRHLQGIKTPPRIPRSICSSTPTEGTASCPGDWSR